MLSLQRIMWPGENVSFVLPQPTELSMGDYVQDDSIVGWCLLLAETP